MNPSFSAPHSGRLLDDRTIRSIIIGIMLAMFLAALDQTIVATALPAIGRDLGNAEDLSWTITAYLLSSTTVAPLYGKFSDVYGRRLMLLTSIGIFVAGSVACALAPSMTLLAAARALQGMGGGGLISLSQTIIADIMPPKERAKLQGYFATVFATASVVGPVLGGVLAEYLHWSVIFWINLPLGFLAWMMTSRALRVLPRHERPHRIDVIGAALMVLASILLLLALAWGGIRFEWLSLPIVCLLIASAIAWLLFTLRVMTAFEPFLPLSVVVNPVVGPAILTGFFGAGVYLGLTIYIPLYLGVGLGASPARSGLALIPLVGGIVIGSMVSARFMTRLRHYKRPALVGLGSAIGGVAVIAAMPLSMPMPAVVALLGFIGVGMGSIFSMTTVSIQNAVVPHQTGIATASLNFFRSLGGAILVAGFGAIVLGGLGQGSGQLHLDAAGIEAARMTGDLTSVFRWLFVAADTCLAVSFVCLWVMEERPLRIRVHAAPDGESAPTAP
jgi:EmrB/QacA subfamily drug resistance transporter